MNDERKGTRETIGRVLDLAEELEASGEAMLEGTTLDKARAALHQWVDSMTGIVITPALGRVTVVHGGTESTISSPDLPFVMSTAVGQKAVG